MSNGTTLPHQTNSAATASELTVEDITVIDNKLLKRAVGAAALGNTMEWFDFGVYSYLAVIIGQVFFPVPAAPHS